MSKYTPQERLDIYEKVLEEFLITEQLCLCRALAIATSRDTHYYGNMPNIFPEIWNQRPRNDVYGWWWPYNDEGYLQRVVAVLEAIKEVKKIIKDAS